MCSKWIAAEIEGRTRYVIGNASGFGSCDQPPRKLEVKALQRELLAAGANLGQTLREIPGL